MRSVPAWPLGGGRLNPQAGAALIAGFELLIAFTGNYAFFNLLTIVLCVLAVDDSCWRRWLPARVVQRIAAEVPAGASGDASADRPMGAVRALRAAVAVALL